MGGEDRAIAGHEAAQKALGLWEGNVGVYAGREKKLPGWEERE